MESNPNAGFFAKAFPKFGGKTNISRRLNRFRLAHRAYVISSDRLHESTDQHVFVKGLFLNCRIHERP